MVDRLHRIQAAKDPTRDHTSGEKGIWWSQGRGHPPRRLGRLEDIRCSGVGRGRSHRSSAHYEHRRINRRGETTQRSQTCPKDSSFKDCQEVETVGATRSSAIKEIKVVCEGRPWPRSPWLGASRTNRDHIHLKRGLTNSSQSQVVCGSRRPEECIHAIWLAQETCRQVILPTTKGRTARAGLSTVDRSAGRGIWAGRCTSPLEKEFEESTHSITTETVQPGPMRFQVVWWCDTGWIACGRGWRSFCSRRQQVFQCHGGFAEKVSIWKVCASSRGGPRCIL